MAMSENLPDEIIANIVSRLPVKSVGQFRCVSKQWYSSLSDPKFIKAHSHKHEEIKLILTSHVSHSIHTITFNPKPQNGIDAILTKLNFKEKWRRVIGSCNGLVLVLNKNDVVFLMNPTTLEYRTIPNSPLPLPRRGTYTTYALGYDVAADDYKVITLSYYKDKDVHEGDLFCAFVHVYSVRMGIWRRLERVYFIMVQFLFMVFLNGALHWFVGKYYRSPCAIVAFDLSDEKFFQVPIPTTTYEYDYMEFCEIVALKGCLCMLANGGFRDKFDVWMMNEYGVAESWTKFAVIRNTCPYGFAPVCLMSDDDIVMDVPEKEEFIIYNLKEERCREMNIDGITCNFSRARTFMESLVSPMIGKGTEGGDYIT